MEKWKGTEKTRKKKKKTKNKGELVLEEKAWAHKRGKKKEEKIKEGKREKRYRLVLDRKVYPRFCLFGFFQWNLFNKEKTESGTGGKGRCNFPFARRR